MDYPIIEVKTSDNLYLFGLLSQPAHSTTLYLHIHGSGGNFFCDEYERTFYEELPKLGIDVLFTNNRGSYALDSWQDTGAALEIFEDSLLDLDAWIKWAVRHSYKKIILSGHSHGTEKVVYYLNKGKNKDKINAVVLMGFCDTIGTQESFEKKVNINFMEEALKKVASGKGYELLTSHRRAQAGELPISAQTYINYFSKDSELSRVTPFRLNSSLPMINSIKIPVLATIGDHEEYTIIPIVDAIKLLKKENSLVEVHQVIGSNHMYDKYQQDLISLISNFLRSLKLTSQSFN